MRRIRTQGFTLLEVLVSLALLGIVIVAILAPLTGLFGMSQRSTRQVAATTQAQQAIELIRGQWLDPARYASNCVVGPLPAGVQVLSVQDEDVRGSVQMASVAFSVGTESSCPSGSSPAVPGPPLRKVSVSAVLSGSTSVLQTEVARP
ncbi:type II secretion system GspH family protein [Deinococcus sp. KNUC1210]|uniref:PulJ/GspJ family protein n=1 Tax=Deinococcus sp. KNUC1210 TaxID=2917691 RepID=UPI001EF128CB|nr:type II secretion system protein [Deinococcus sp. KNUC1210]ULH16792.1 type II secretion system GspH family protein [Deinococcus sp. KNUC1210]